MQRNVDLSDGGWRQPVTQPLKIFTFEAFFMKSLLMAKSLEPIRKIIESGDET
jgi:hypothetical protein